MEILMLLSGVLGLGSLACFIMVIVKMFQNDKTGIAIACLVGIPACLIGPLVAFVYGWMKSTEWQIQTLMLVWTGCLLGGIVIQVIAISMGGAAMWDVQQQMQQQMPDMPR